MLQLIVWVVFLNLRLICYMVNYEVKSKLHLVLRGCSYCKSHLDPYGADTRPHSVAQTSARQTQWARMVHSMVSFPLLVILDYGIVITTFNQKY